jgi:hypothetical protein
VEVTNGTGSGSCPLVGFGIDDVEPLGTVTKSSVVFWRRKVVEVTGGWQQLRIVSTGRLWH